MKKLGLFLVCVVATYVASAQKTVTFGHTAGVGNTWLSNGDQLTPGYNDQELHVGYSIGMRMIASGHPHWGVISDLKFSSEGGSFGRDGADGTRVLRANYLRHSMQAAYFFGDRGNRVRPRLSAGPSIAIYAGGKSRLKDAGSESLPDMKSKLFFKTWDFGLTGAAGVNVRLKESTWLSAEAAYYHGLTNVNDVTELKVRNRGLAFNIGLMVTPDYEKMKKHMKM